MVCKRMAQAQPALAHSPFLLPLAAQADSQRGATCITIEAAPQARGAPARNL
jgi:hypothetical protein